MWAPTKHSNYTELLLLLHIHYHNNNDASSDNTIIKAISLDIYRSIHIPVPRGHRGIHLSPARGSFLKSLLVGSIKFMLDFIRGKPVRFSHHPNTKTLSLHRSGSKDKRQSKLKAESTSGALCLKYRFYFRCFRNVLGYMEFFCILN